MRVGRVVFYFLFFNYLVNWYQFYRKALLHLLRHSIFYFESSIIGTGSLCICESMADDLNENATSGGSSSKEGMTVDQCQEIIQKSFRNPTVKFLMEHLEKSGCSIGKNFIKATNCDKQISGGYVRGEGIVVCSNQLQFQDEVNQVLIHELIHAYDDCRAENLDWTDCAHHACSEIRAGHLSGDCSYKRELLRGYTKLRGHEQDCVRRRVMRSVTSNPYCSRAAAKDAMEAVWDVCYNDTKPFDRAP